MEYSPPSLGWHATLPFPTWAAVRRPRRRLRLDFHPLSLLPPLVPPLISVLVVSFSVWHALFVALASIPSRPFAAAALLLPLVCAPVTTYRLWSTSFWYSTRLQSHFPCWEWKQSDATPPQAPHLLVGWGHLPPPSSSVRDRPRLRQRQGMATSRGSHPYQRYSYSHAQDCCLALRHPLLLIFYSSLLARLNSILYTLDCVRHPHLLPSPANRFATDHPHSVRPPQRRRTAAAAAASPSCDDGHPPCWMETTTTHPRSTTSATPVSLSLVPLADYLFHFHYSGSPLHPRWR